MMIPIKTTTMYTIFIIKQCLCIHFIDIPSNSQEDNYYDNPHHSKSEKKPPPEIMLQRRLMEPRKSLKDKAGYEDEKDANIKVKISTLVQQTIHDTERKISSIKHIKEKYREEPPYKAGFILSMIKKSRDVLNELFNVAVKHKDEWKALEQLKIFELIVHTNVDTTNLVRQLVEVHIQHLNSTSTGSSSGRKRVVLLK